MKPKYYVLTFGYGEPSLSEPFDTPEARDAAAKEIFEGGDFTQGEDDIGRLDIDENGVPTVGCYTNAELGDEDLGDDEELDV